MTRNAESIENWTINGTNTGTIVFDHAVSTIGIHVAYTTDATVGNRELMIEILDASAVLIMNTGSASYQTASLAREYNCMDGIYREAAFKLNRSINVPLPTGYVIPAGGSILIKDAAGISATDSYVAKIQTERLY